MDNPEKLATLGIQDTGQRPNQTKSKTKKNKIEKKHQQQKKKHDTTLHRKLN